MFSASVANSHVRKLAFASVRNHALANYNCAHCSQWLWNEM